MARYGVNESHTFDLIGAGSHATVFVVPEWNPRVAFKFFNMKCVSPDNPFEARAYDEHQDALAGLPGDAVVMAQREALTLLSIQKKTEDLQAQDAKLPTEDGLEETKVNFTVAPRLVLPKDAASEEDEAYEMAGAAMVVAERAYPLVIRTMADASRVAINAALLISTLFESFRRTHYDLHPGQIMSQNEGENRPLMIVDWSSPSVPPVGPHDLRGPSMIHPDAQHRLHNTQWTAGCIVLCFLCKGDRRYAFTTRPAPNEHDMALAWSRVFGPPPADLVSPDVLQRLESSADLPRTPPANAEEFAKRVTELHGGEMYSFTELRAAWETAFDILGGWRHTRTLESALLGDADH